MKKTHHELLHTVLLIIASLLTFVFPKTPLVRYDIETAGLIFILFFGLRRFLPSRFFSTRKILESIGMTLIILIMVNSSGGTGSPYFFLVYFLLFSVSLLLEPVVSLSLSLSLVIMYLFTLPPAQSISALAPIFSLAFLSPFSLFLGQEYIKNEQLKKKNQQLQADTFLFLSLIIKNHLRSIKYALENFMGDHELQHIRKHTKEIEKLIDTFEKKEQ